MKFENFLKGPLTSLIGVALMCAGGFGWWMGWLTNLEGGGAGIVGFALLFAKDTLLKFIGQFLQALLDKFKGGGKATVILMLISSYVFSQSTDAQLTTQANVIRNETSPSGNTKTRIADMFQSIINSKMNYSYLNGDRGPITVSNFGLTWTVDAGAFSVSNISMNTNRLLGRTTAGSGAVEEITVSAPLTFTSGALGFPIGVSNQIPVVNGTTLGYSNNFWRDGTNNNFYSYASTTNTNTGTQNNNFLLGHLLQLTGTGGNIRWAQMHTEQGILTSDGASGVMHNPMIDGGFNNKIEKTSGWNSFSCGILNSNNSYIGALTASTTSSLVFCARNDTILNASNALATGYRTKVTGDGAFGHGFFDTYSGGSHTGTIQSCEIAGKGGFGFFTNTSASTVGRGEQGPYGVILGGFDPYIPPTSTRCGVYGGNGIAARASDDDQHYFPNLNIDTAPTQNDTLDHVIMRYRASAKRGQLQTRSANTISTSSRIRTITTTTSAALTDGTILVDASGGVVTLNLPTAASAYDSNNLSGRKFTIVLISATNSVVVDGNGSETISGATTQTISTQWQPMSIQSNGTMWIVTSN